MSDRLPRPTQPDDGRLGRLERRIEKVVETQLEQSHKEGIILAELGRVNQSVRHLEQLLAGQVVEQVLSALPPMRAESPSSHELTRHVSREIAEQFEAESRNTTTPPPDAAKVEAISESVVQVAITRLKSEQWDKLQAERDAVAREQRAAARELTKRKWATAAGIAGTAASTLAWLVEHWAHRR